MREHLVAYFEAHHKLLEASALALLLDSPQPFYVSRQLVEHSGTETPFVTREMVETALATARPVEEVAPAPIREALSGGRGPLVEAPAAAAFELLHEGFVPSHSPRPPLEAYSALFASRFRTLSRLLRGRPDLPNLRPIRELRTSSGKLSIIAMVREVRTTAERRHVLLTVEDETGATELLVPRDSPVARTTFLPDEVVGLNVTRAREPGRLARVDGVARPEVSAGRSRRSEGARGRVLFLSDLHVGSRSFLSDSWGALAEFLHGRGPRSELAESIGQVVVAGDLVDGIGIYPNQERDLAIGDIVEQYAELGRRLRELPERLEIVVLPGNHDAVCPAEPQPGLPAALRELLPSNVRSVGNPSTFALHGVVVEAYHGRSFDDLIPALPGLTYERPTEVMKRMLSMRHLAPMYGGRTPLAPQARDGLVIDPAPDILVTGHTHTFGVDRHRGVLLLNASTWQAETEYQRMRNIVPVPARAAIVDLATLDVDALDFSSSDRALAETSA